MPSRAESLFQRLQSREAIAALIGQAEDADFDCKQWRGNAETMRGSIAKAACGFCNATGGVIVIGIRAEGRGKEPDVVQELVPVQDMGAVKAAALDIILKFVKPGIEGVQVELVPDANESISGYVLIFIPEGEGGPQRTDTVPKDFFVRVASGTIPMEYFQIEDRFGRRPRARLIIGIADERVSGQPMYNLAERTVRISVANDGRGIARFPSLRFAAGFGFHPTANPYGLNLPAWPHTNSIEGWHTFRGGSNDFIHPGETVSVATLTQPGNERQRTGENAYGPYAHMPERRDWNFAAAKIIAVAVCDGADSVRRTFEYDAHSHIGGK